MKQFLLILLISIILMTTIIEGYVCDAKGQGITGVLIEVFQKALIGGDVRLSHFPPPGPDITNNKGYFRVALVQDHSPKDSLYVRVTGPQQQASKFTSVRDRQSRYKKRTDFEEDTVNPAGPKERWLGEVLKNLDDVIYIDVTLEPIVILAKYDTIIIGSGFGGTVSALTVAKVLDKDNKANNKKNKVCILERGQWWVSHEMPATKEGTTDGKPTIREYLHHNNMPYSTWAYPNDIRGLFTAFGNSRRVNKIKGLYDYRQLKNVHILAASGVGGGSLVYTNVTEEPDGATYANWPTQSDGEPGLENYFDRAFRFIGVNPIVPNASIGRFELPRAKVFQEAAQAISESEGTIMNNVRKDENGNPILNANNNKPLLDFDARLSITEIPEAGHIFSNEGPLEFYARVDKNKEVENLNPQEKLETLGTKYSAETNVCQRQGRCGLGCIPGARHTLNKQIFSHMKGGLPIDVHSLCEVLEIEEISPGKYAVKFLDYRELLDDEDFSPIEEISEQKKANITKIIKTDRVVLSAGTLGSTELLLKSKKLDLSNKLGTKFSTNGDFFGIINPTKHNVDASRGPTQTSIALFKDGINGQFLFSIEDVGIPQMFAETFAFIFDLMRQEKGNNFIPKKSFIKLFEELVLKNMDLNNTQTLSTLARLMDSSNISVLSSIGNVISGLINLFSNKPNLTAEERVSNMMVLFGIGRDNNTISKLILGNGNKIDLDNDYDLNQPIFGKIIDGMRLFARKIGKEEENSLLIPLWDQETKSTISAHPLGGCPMGSDASNGVVDSIGRVFKGQNGTNTYQGLYVADGSIIPTPLGVNPSLTITTLALRIAFHIVGAENLP